MGCSLRCPRNVRGGASAAKLDAILFQYLRRICFSDDYDAVAMTVGRFRSMGLAVTQ